MFSHVSDEAHILPQYYHGSRKYSWPGQPIGKHSDRSGYLGLSVGIPGLSDRHSLRSWRWSCGHSEGIRGRSAGHSWAIGRAFGLSAEHSLRSWRGSCEHSEGMCRVFRGYLAGISSIPKAFPELSPGIWSYASSIWSYASDIQRRVRLAPMAWTCLVLFVRIGTFQWVTANPNKNNPAPVSDPVRNVSGFHSSFLLGPPLARRGFDPANGKTYEPLAKILTNSV